MKERALCRLGVMVLCGSLVPVVSGQVQRMSLREFLKRVERRSAEVELARLEAERAWQRVELGRDPFVPKAFAGSGLAYTSGFPMSIEGAAPSVIEARVVGALIDLPRSRELEAARVLASAQQLAVEDQRSAVLLHALELVLDWELARRRQQWLEQQIDSVERTLSVTEARVSEGLELPLAARRVAWELLQLRQQLEESRGLQSLLEARMSVTAGLGPNQRVQLELSDLPRTVVPSDVGEAIQHAWLRNGRLQRLERELRAARLRESGARAERWPRIALVAQYGLFSRFNNYEEFFRKFQRNNAQLGMAFEIPLWLGPASKARVGEAVLEQRRLKIEIEQERARIALAVGQAFQSMHAAERRVEVAEAGLQLAEEEWQVMEARFQEGKATLTELEAKRRLWLERAAALEEARLERERARWRLAYATGELLERLEPWLQ